MEELLQLHVVIPEEVPDKSSSEVEGGYDDVHDLIHDRFPVPNEDIPSYDHLGTTVSSSLFERRTDNLEHVDEIEAQINKWYPDAPVFRSLYDQSHGEFRSAADPSRHIMLLVANQGIQQPAVRWKQRKDTLQAPSLILGNEIFNANYDGIFSIDSSSGDIQWDGEGGHAIQVPVGNENKIIGNTGHELVALERSTGDIQWRTEFDLSEDEIIDSRVVLGSENAYVGLRTGDVIEISLATGGRKVLGTCDSPVTRLKIIEPGLIAVTNGSGMYLIDSSGKTEWPEHADVAPSILHSQGGNLYASAEESLLAINDKNGTVKWEVEFPTVKNIVQFDDILIAATTEGLIAVNTETGDKIWNHTVTEDSGTVLNPVVVDNLVACISSNNISDGEFYTELVIVNAKTGNEVCNHTVVEGYTATTSDPMVVDGIVAYITSNKMSDGEVYACERNILHIFDPTDGTEIQRFELGVGDCYGLSAMTDALICSAGGELICLENFPEPA